MDRTEHHGLLDTIYKCALGLSEWSEVCHQIHDALPGSGVIFHLHEARSHANVGLTAAGFDPGAEAQYLSHYVHTNPWLAAQSHLPVGVLHHSEDCCDQETLLASEFWNDWLRPQGQFAAGSSIVLTREFERTGLIAIDYDHRKDGPRERADALLAGVGSHLQRAFSLWRTAAVNREKVSLFQGCLSTLSLPLAVVDGHGRVRFANPHFEAVARRLDGLSIGSDRTLHAVCRVSDARLHEAIAAIAGNARQPAPLVSIPKTGRDGPTGARYIASIFPAPADVEDLGFGSFSFYDGSLAMLAIHDSEAVLHLDPRQLVETFDLTRAEAELASAVLEGLTLSDHARAKRVSRYTVRNQLSSVMRKTGTTRQAELVGILTRLAMTR